MKKFFNLTLIGLLALISFGSLADSSVSNDTSSDGEVSAMCGYWGDSGYGYGYGYGRGYRRGYRHGRGYGHGYGYSDYSGYAGNHCWQYDNSPRRCNHHRSCGWNYRLDRCEFVY